MNATLNLVVIGALLAGTVSVSAQAPADPPRQTFRSSTDVVSIQASVRDKRGRPMSGLTTADFEVRDNGQLRPVISLRSDRQSPVSVAVLIDTSGSMRVGPKMAMAREVFSAMLGQLREGEDELAIFTFDSKLHERQPFVSQFAGLASTLDELKPFGATSLYDATAATARRLAERSAAHKAIVILTDGVDTSSELTPAEVSSLASSISVPVYVVATLPNVDQVAMMESLERAGQSSADLRQLADWTGGRLLITSTNAETQVSATRLVDELRQQYVIAIEAAGVNEWRRLEVKVRERSATVKARSGYFGG
jgi:Ca-activated chloride channel family protein